MHGLDQPLHECLEGLPGKVLRLQDVLEAEFQALRQRDLGQFEHLQTEKSELLSFLSAVAQTVAPMDPVPAAWQARQEELQACKQAHMRNTQLLQRQLLAVRGALQALQGDKEVSVDLYDRMGQISRRGAAWSQTLA